MAPTLPVHGRAACRGDLVASRQRRRPPTSGAPSPGAAPRQPVVDWDGVERDGKRSHVLACSQLLGDAFLHQRDPVCSGDDEREGEEGGDDDLHVRLDAEELHLTGGRGERRWG